MLQNIWICVLLCFSISYTTATTTRRPFMTKSSSFDDYDEDLHHLTSCKGRCETQGHDKTLPCQCNYNCVKYNDCCSDYETTCLSCQNKCDIRHDSDLPCQCNNKCMRFNDCCDDYQNTCAPPRVTDNELSTLSESLLSADNNNAASLIRVNLQGSTSFHSSRDVAPEPLLVVESSAYEKPTIAKLLPLYNNYVANVTDAENVTPQESQEVEAFLDAILATTVMSQAEQFLVDKRYIIKRQRKPDGTYSINNRAFREALTQIWFGLYTRENGTLGSSGFEHVFLGEVKDGKVSGFHSWPFFAREEANNNVNYKGKIGNTVSLGSKGQIIKLKFDWNRTEKPISSMFVGTSPEFEMAIYSICYYSRPGSRCPVKLNGRNVNIQTHYIQKRGKRFLGSSFPDI